MQLSEYKSGDRAGAPRIAALVEITEGPFAGAGIWHSLSYTDPLGAKWMNNFLEALTDGTEGQKKSMREAFWGKGFDADSKDEHGRAPVTMFAGRKPGSAMKVVFITKMGTWQGEQKAEIAHFVALVSADAAQMTGPSLTTTTTRRCSPAPSRGPDRLRHSRAGGGWCCPPGQWRTTE